MSLNAAATPGYGFTPAAQAAETSSKDTSPLYPYHPTSVAKALIETANALVVKGKGIYATDETPEGIQARLTAAMGPNSREFTAEEHTKRRRDYRACLYETIPTEHISGVILHHETLIDFQLAPILSKRGIIPGVRADTDSHPLPSSPAEPATQGLDDLLPRLQAAYKAGARFTKWRAPILCDSGKYPTQNALEAQADSLARFAAISQQAGLVPIVEPDVDFAGDASLGDSVDAHIRAISAIYARCLAHGVLIEGSLIKPSFPQPGTKHSSRTNITPQEIAQATAAVLARAVPVGVAGVVFLSGGLDDETSAAYLRAANKLCFGNGSPNAYARLPPLTYSFGRGLQGDAMTHWVKGDEKATAEAFARRAKVCSDASQGL